MRAMTPAERIASVDCAIRKRMIWENQSGIGMKKLAINYRISETTVRAIIRASKQDPSYDPPPPLPDDLWNRPDLWRLHGLQRPTTPRMVEIARSHRRS